MKNRILFAFVAMPLIASATSYAAPSDDAASSREPQVENKRVDVSLSPMWLEGQGEMTSSQVITTLGVEATPQQRAQIETAVNARNTAIRAANAQLSTQLRVILKTDDAALSKRAATQKEARELAIIRRRQPGRYQSMKRKMEAQEK